MSWYYSVRKHNRVRYMSGELIKVGKYDLKYNKILDIDIAELDIYG